jgi:O-antigen/teichoic acid export membrane protein
VFSVVLGMLMAALYLRKIFPSFYSRKMGHILETKKLLHFSWPLFFVGFFYLIILWMNTLLIGYFLSSDDVGIFGAAHSLAMFGLIVVNAFVSIFAPVISDLTNKKEYGKLKSLFKGITKWIFTLSLPVFVLMIYFAEDILDLTFGEKFVQGASVLVIMSVALSINSFIGAAGFLTVMSGKPKIELINLGAVLFVNAVLSVILIPREGIEGAAFASLIAFVLLNLLRLVEVGILFRMHPFRKDLYKPIIAGGTAFLTLSLIVNFFLQNMAPKTVFLGGSVIFVFVYGLIILILGLGDEDRMVIEKIKGKFKPA